MVDSLRALLPRVAPYRPDLNEGGLVDFWLQETTRKIARDTNMYREVLSTAAVTAYSDYITVTPSGGYNLKRVERVRVPVNLFNLAASKGNWNASTNTPTITTGSASSSNSGWFYIVTVAGATDVDGTTTWNVGDIIQSSGAEWVRMPKEGFQTIREINLPTNDQVNRFPQANAGTVLRWGQTIENPTGTLYLFPPPLYDTAIELLISEIPTGELYDIGTLPTEVEDCIVLGTMAQILALPSTKPGMQNLQLSQDYNQRFEMALANLKTRSLYGFGGSAQAVPPNFTGTWRFKYFWGLR